MSMFHLQIPYIGLYIEFSLVLFVTCNRISSRPEVVKLLLFVCKLDISTFLFKNFKFDLIVSVMNYFHFECFFCFLTSFKLFICLTLSFNACWLFNTVINERLFYKQITILSQHIKIILITKKPMILQVIT